MYRDINNDPMCHINFEDNSGRFEWHVYITQHVITSHVTKADWLSFNVTSNKTFYHETSCEIQICRTRYFLKALIVITLFLPETCSPKKEVGLAIYIT